MSGRFFVKRGDVVRAAYRAQTAPTLFRFGIDVLHTRTREARQRGLLGTDIEFPVSHEIVTYAIGDVSSFTADRTPVLVTGDTIQEDGEVVGLLAGGVFTGIKRGQFFA